MYLITNINKIKETLQKLSERCRRVILKTAKIPYIPNNKQSRTLPNNCYSIVNTDTSVEALKQACIPKREKIHLFSNHSAVKREQIIFTLNIIQRRQESGIGISFIDSQTISTRAMFQKTYNRTTDNEDNCQLYKAIQ